jgi:lipopolysaccharide/colanic/teichoic acid biosynthesis glycosyltransferase
LALVLLWPILVVCAIAVRLKLGSPVLFIQERPGRDGRPFSIFKFRTMLAADPARGLVSDSDRLTPFGRFLRSTSIDELPSLLNVLAGDMSLVGPRPLLMSYLARYTPEQARRHEVRPGITGWAQVAGRNALTWDDKLALDVWYVDNRSFMLDLQILIRTVGLVLRRHGISAAGHETAPEFSGFPDQPQ